MSKPSSKPAGPITRRQQVAALRKIKTQEVAEAVASMITGNVREEVDRQLTGIKDTMFDLIDRMVGLESDSTDRHEGTEATLVPVDDKVVPEPSVQGAGDSGEDGAEGPNSG